MHQALVLYLQQLKMKREEAELKQIDTLGKNDGSGSFLKTEVCKQHDRKRKMKVVVRAVWRSGRGNFPRIHEIKFAKAQTRNYRTDQKTENVL